MLSYITGIATIALIYVIATVGLSVFTGFTGLFSLGHAGFVAVGAYTAGILTYFYEVPFWLALPAGGVMAGLVGMIIGYPTLRAKLRSDYFAIATLGFGEAVRVILENLDITQGARGLPGITRYTDLSVTIVVALLFIVLARNFINSKYGRQAIAVREDFTAAEMMGINLMRVRMRSLVFSAVAAGISGGLLAHYISFIQPAMFTAVMSTQLTAAVVAGGMGSITGPVIAAFVFVAVPEALRVANIWRLVAYGFLLVLIIVVRPQGILGYQDISWQGIGRLFNSRKRGRFSRVGGAE